MNSFLTSKAPSSNDRALGLRIRELRNQVGLTLEEVAGELGLTYQQCQKYELGQNRIPAGRLLDIAAVLGIDVKLFFMTGPVSTPELVEAETKAAHILSLFERLSPESKKVAETMLQALAMREGYDGKQLLPEKSAHGK